MINSRELYLDLLKRCLLNAVYGHAEVDMRPPFRQLASIWNVGAWLFRRCGLVLARLGSFDAHVRAEGLDWPPFAHTMVDLKRLDNVQWCVEQVLQTDDARERVRSPDNAFGIAISLQNSPHRNGRSSAPDAGFHKVPRDRPNPEKYPADGGDDHHAYPDLAVSLVEVQRNFALYGLLDDRVRFLEGWFADTLPNAPVERIAVLRLDGDMYESTINALAFLYPKLSIGGYCIIDDYGAVPGCRCAVEDYRREHGIVEAMRPIDWTGVFWKRESQEGLVEGKAAGRAIQALRDTG